MQINEVDPRRYFPSVYDDVLEIDELADTERQTFEEALVNLDSTWANQWIITANLDGIKAFEKVLGIIANPSTETLQFRRERLLNRYSLTPPFTMPFLRMKLDEIIGVGRWTASIDYANRVLTVGAAVTNSAWSQEIAITITQIKPANLVFISSPEIFDGIKVSEAIVTRERQNNYLLGISWFLGSTPFVTYENERTIKMPTVSSIRPAFLEIQATHPVTDISKVRINNSYVIEDFSSKSSSGPVTTLEYLIPVDSGLGAITKIELLSATDEVLTSANVYVDITYDILVAHKITFKEDA